MTAFETGPYLAAAFLCERVLMEQDGVPSFIRVVDVFTRPVVTENPSDPLPPEVVVCTLAVTFKPGDARGSFDVALRIEKPSGEQQEMGAFNVHFDGGPARGANVFVNLELEMDQEGVWWIDVLGGPQQRLMTRIPAELRYQRLRANPQRT